MIDNNNFVVIQGFMINELKLKGNDLIIYAIIYGFSQTENQEFTGSLNYLAEWTSSTKQGVLKNLKNLLDRGLIAKEEVYVNNVKFVKYRIIPLNKVEYPIKHSLPNNIDNNINNNINNNLGDIERNNKKVQKERKEKALQDIQDLVNSYTDNKELKDTIQDFITMRKEIKKPMTPIAVKRLLNKLDKLATNDLDKIEILENSISHNWQDIYQLKNRTNRTYTPVDISHIKGLRGDTKTEEDFINF